MKIKELLARDITATIDPVIYFHQKNPETLAREVAEYVITSKNDREETGIHEQYVKLLKAMSASLNTDEKHPASWISGFFGSGKSSFAKLLGLSFGEIKLPSGKFLSEALIERDDTPNAHVFQNVWKECKDKFGKTLAVVFDISAEAKSLELPSSVIYRQIQIELGYSNKEAVAKYELALQKEGKYDLFLEKYREHYKNEWKNEKDKSKAPDEFSFIYHTLYPIEFPKPTDWFKTHYNNHALKEVEAIRRAAQDIKDMIDIRHSGKRLLVVIDEMSQFIGKNTDRMLNLQTFVSEIGSLSGNPIWLFVTGQEKLEDNVPGIEISKMQDRFPSKFRVHLHKTNVNEIVRRRILKKSDEKISYLKTLFNQETISRIKNNGYNSEQVTQEELIDFYPLLPSYVPLLLEISQAIKFYSAKAQADSASVRSVLQTIYDLFNSERTNFKDREIGALVTMKDVYDIIGSALGSEIALTIDSITKKLSHELPSAVEIARIIAILEMNSEKEPVTRELIQRMLFSHVNEPASKELITEALERLDKENFIYVEDKRGYRIKDTVAQEWGKDKARIAVSEEEIGLLINKYSFEIMDSVAKPKIFDIPIELEISHKGKPEKNKPLPKVRLDLHFRSDGLYDGTKDYFISESQKEFPNNYSKERFILFVPGDTDRADSLARQILQAEKMLKLHSGSLSKVKQKVYDDENRKVESDKDKLNHELLLSWAKGKLYFLGREFALEGNHSEEQFKTKLRQQIESYLPEMYSRFRDAQVNVTQKEMEKLFESEIISPSPVLLDGSDGLSILTRQAGKYETIVDRGIPQRILDFIKDKVSVKGEFLLGFYGSQPFGYPQNVIQAVVVGLLRAEVIKIKQPNGREATSFKDEGIKDTLLNTSSFKQIDVQSNQDIDLGPRDKKQCADFFVGVLGFPNVQVDSNSIYEAIFKHFPSLVESVLGLNNQITKLGLPLPTELNDLHKNLDLCRKDKSVAGSVRMLKHLLPDLKEGIHIFKEAKQYFTPENEDRIRRFINLQEHEIRQLKEIEENFAIDEDIKRVENKLKSDKPWKDLSDLISSYDLIQSAYKEIRLGIITKNQQEIESAYFQIQTRLGFDSLTEIEKEEIKSILESSLQSQDIGSLHPTLLYIRNLGNQIERDKAKANDLLDEFLSKKEMKLEIRKVNHNLTNKDISSEEDLRKVLSELESKCLLELGKGYSIRLV